MLADIDTNFVEREGVLLINDEDKPLRDKLGRNWRSQIEQKVKKRVDKPGSGA